MSAEPVLIRMYGFPFLCFTFYLRRGTMHRNKRANHADQSC